MRDETDAGAVAFAGAHLRAWRPDKAELVRVMAQGSPDLWRQLPDPDRIEPDFCEPANGDGGTWKFAICDAGRPVGNVGVRIRGMRVGWCSYWLSGPARGRGLATAALRALADLAFTELDAFRLELAHRVDNPASGAVAHRAGFVAEGVMRAELEYDGVRYDTRLWSRLVTDPAPSGAALPIVT